MKVLIIDNYDSFTYNLVHLVESILNTNVYVFRNDAIALAEVATFDKIIVSPGPGLPVNAGITLPLIKQYANTKSILGVCLGQQAIAEAYGAKLKNLPTVFHGVKTDIQQNDNNDSLFKGVPLRFEAGRYHSWVIDPQTMPAELKITAVDKDQNIMAISHKTLDVKGVQFHPESVMTGYGTQILRNWLVN